MKIDSKNAPSFVKHLELLAKLDGRGYIYAFDTYKALKSLERYANRICTEECNGTIEEDKADRALERIKAKVIALLPNLPPEHFFINGDPRGYSLKIKEAYAREVGAYQDWGGYGIIAPEF